MGEPHRRSRGLDSGDPSRKTCQHLEAPPAHPAAAGAGQRRMDFVWEQPNSCQQLPLPPLNARAVTAQPQRPGHMENAPGVTPAAAWKEAPAPLAASPG